MPKVKPRSYFVLRAILAYVSSEPHGASVAMIRDALAHRYPADVIQAATTRLVQRGGLVSDTTHLRRLRTVEVWGNEVPARKASVCNH